MKKVFAIALCVCLLAMSLAGCGEKEYKLGMGVSLNMDSSDTGNAQVDAAVAAVVTDAAGKIVSCRIDVAQSKMDITDGEVDAGASFRSKMELGSEYGMAGKVDNDGDGVMLEWDAQARAFEEFVVGKTADEVKNLPLQEANGHQISADDALLKAGCSMQITEFIDAVAAACNDEQGMTFKGGEFTLGVAAKTNAEESTPATEDEDGLVAMYTDFAAAVVSGGKIIACINDAVQPKITINSDGEIMETSYTNTKRGLKDAYGMAPAVNYGMDWNGDGKVLEWYQQSAEFSKYVLGKTADEVAGMPTKEAEGSDGAYIISAEDALLNAGCTIQVTSLQATTAQAARNAR